MSAEPAVDLENLFTMIDSGKLLLVENEHPDTPYTIISNPDYHDVQEEAEKTYVYKTSLTLDYRKEAWGLERLVLDCISNHLPADSGGTETHVKFKQDGEYVDLKEVDREKEIEEIVMADDGRGYPVALLSVLFSTKTDHISVGQVGEGLKMAAGASLREGQKNTV